MCLHRILRFVILTACCGLSACSLGCHRGYDRYVPSETKSREALEAALTAWQNGQSPDDLAAGSPAIRVVDARWQRGQKLGKFQIVGEEPGEGPTYFAVRLALKGQPAEQVVRYVVVGRDPLWVYREDEFKTSAGM